MEISENGLKDAFFPDLGVVRCETFSKVYPVMNNYILSHKEWEQSRDGMVKEMLDIKTNVLNPYRRCVGGLGRDINIFFLLAEAMWIFSGRKDVRFLTYFNAKMADFSDYGEVFHAPYGFRLRHAGVRSEDKFTEENLHAAQGSDQIACAVRVFSNNPNSRQVVLSIWNHDFDLGIASKDIPCNDMVMLKIRNGKLITTIQNRSNDLHWGLPTNLFQFSFLTEMIAGILGIELGTQTHNSQSLHLYEWNDIANSMFTRFKTETNKVDLYDVSGERKVDFNFVSDVPNNRLRELDIIINYIIESLTNVAEGKEVSKETETIIEAFSTYLFNAYKLLSFYLQYKAEFKKAGSKEEKEAIRSNYLGKIEILAKEKNCETQDIFVLAMNFFATRLSNYVHPYLGKL